MSKAFVPALAVATALVFLLAGCSTPVQTLKPGADGKYTIALTSDNRFSPAGGKLPLGAVVVFSSAGYHDVQIQGPDGLTASSGEAGALHPGDSWTYTFAKAGSYHVFCHLHSSYGMKGDFVIEDSGSLATTPAPAPTPSPTPAPSPTS